MWIQQYYVKQLQFEQWSDASLNIVQYFLTFTIILTEETHLKI